MSFAYAEPRGVEDLEHRAVAELHGIPGVGSLKEPLDIILAEICGEPPGPPEALYRVGGVSVSVAMGFPEPAEALYCRDGTHGRGDAELCLLPLVKVSEDALLGHGLQGERRVLGGEVVSEEQEIREVGGDAVLRELLGEELLLSVPPELRILDILNDHLSFPGLAHLARLLPQTASCDFSTL